MREVIIRYIEDTKQNLTDDAGEVIITEDVITIKDASLQWDEMLWGVDGVSVTGKKRENHRGWQAYLEIDFEYSSQLISVAENIKLALDEGNIIQYMEDGVIPITPVSFKYTDDYKSQIKRKPSTLVLEGNIQDYRGLYVTGILCGSEVVTCGQDNVLCGV